MVERLSEWRWSGHGEYLGKEKRGLIDSGPVMGDERDELPGGVASRPVFRRLSLKDLLKRVSAKAELSSDILLRKGRLVNVVQAP